MGNVVKKVVLNRLYVRPKVSLIIGCIVALSSSIALGCDPATSTDKDPVTGAGGAGSPRIKTGGGGKGGSGNAGMFISRANGGRDAEGGSDAEDQNRSAAEKACANHSKEWICVETDLYRCDSEGNPGDSEDCKKEEFCHAGITTGECGVCVPDSWYCDKKENKLKQCDETGQYDKGEDCAYDKCDEKKATCKGACVPKSVVCDDVGKATIECSDKGEQQDPKACPDNLPRCKEGECVQCIDDKGCTGGSDCAPAVCDAVSGKCKTTTAPKGTKCNDDKQVCNETGDCVDSVDQTVEEAVIDAVWVNGLYQVTFQPSNKIEIAADYSKATNISLAVEVNVISLDWRTSYCTINSLRSTPDKCELSASGNAPTTVLIGASATPTIAICGRNAVRSTGQEPVSLGFGGDCRSPILNLTPKK